MAQHDNEQQRITVRIQEPYIEALDKLLERIKLRRDSYLNMVLPDEVESLEMLKSNTMESAKFLRLMRGALSNKIRIAVTLDKSLVERINNACKEKKIVRDAFIERFIEYLVHGDHKYGSCISPLEEAAELLGDPRREYDHSHNPYEDLSMTDKEAKNALLNALDKSFKALIDEL